MNLTLDKSEINKFYYIIYNYSVLAFEHHPPKSCSKPITEEEIIKAHKESAKKTSLYVHIPFCSQSCKFCNCCKISKFKKYDLYSYVDKITLSFDRFTKKLDAKFISVWFGGGTPLILPSELIEKLLAKISNHTDSTTQIIIESTPKEITESKVILLHKYNVNRMTVGVQTFNENLLRYNKRIQNTQEIIEKISILKKYNFNINIDLMVGLPHQTINVFKEDLKKTIDLNPDQIHLHPFTTLHAHDCSKDEINSKLILQREKMLTIGKNVLNNHGYKRQGSEAFVKTNNIANALATSYIFENSNLIAIGDTSEGHVYEKLHYITQYSKDETIYNAVKLTKDIEMERYIALHLLRGLSIDKFNALFSEDFQEKYKNVLTDLSRSGLICIKNNTVKFNKKIEYTNLIKYYLIVKLFWSDESKNYVFNNALADYHQEIDYSQKALREKLFYDVNFIQEKYDALH